MYKFIPLTDVDMVIDRNMKGRRINFIVFVQINYSHRDIRSRYISFIRIILKFTICTINLKQNFNVSLKSVYKVTLYLEILMIFATVLHL